MTKDKITRAPRWRRYIEFMKALERTACAAVAAVVLAGCHETLTQLEPQLVTPASGTGLGLSGPLPGLLEAIERDTLEVITPPILAERLISMAEAALAASRVVALESAENGLGNTNGGDGDAEDLERARELIRWARAALSSGDHARAIQRGYYACRMLGALPR